MSTLNLCALTDELMAVDQKLIEALNHLDVPFVSDISLHLIQSGGKRIRPKLALLSAMALEYQGSSHILAAVILEMIHTATLLHDDVIDGSQVRRGKATANAMWNGTTCILTGDFLYSRSFQLLVELGNPKIMDLFADITNALAAGELTQLTHKNRADISEAQYLTVIQNKTAKLFEAAALIGPIITCHPTHYQAFSDYGLNLGMAFQIADDILDLKAQQQKLGKSPGDDIRDGKITLPLIHALKHAHPDEQDLIIHAIEQGDSSLLEDINHIAERVGAFDMAQQVAEQYAKASQHALKEVPGSPYKDQLIELISLAFNRSK